MYMKKLLNVFFVTLGVIFFIIILLGAYFFITDPLNLKPLLFGTDGEETVAGDGVDKHPHLNEEQEAALETIGVDPADVPSEITPEQEACFEEKLGEERVAEIEAGDSPTTMEMMKAQSCI